MSNSTLMPGVDKQDWALATDKAKDAAAAVGEMAGHAASAVGAMAGQAACDAGKRVDELAANAGVRIQGLGDQLSKNTPHKPLPTPSPRAAHTWNTPRSAESPIASPMRFGRTQSPPSSSASAWAGSPPAN